MDFDLETGKVENLKNLGPCCGLGEFSADGKYLYVAYWGFKTELIQYDLTRPDLEGELIAESIPIHQIQLAPDGKIYMLYNDGEITNMALINEPEKAGLACDFITDVTFPFADDSIPTYLPEPATYLLYNGTDRIDAGPDLEICSGDSIVIGGVNNPIKNYEWSPTENLNNPSIANPTFSYQNLSDTIVTFTYYIKSCETDMMKIKVFPRPKSKIFGSKSVCPGVEMVDYWTDAADSLTYVWNVDGGQLVDGQNTDSIKVTWGKTNPDAGVELVGNNQYNCPQDLLRFPVRINVELQTETPNGEDLLCANLGSGIPYGITNTNGSIYTWESDAGKITGGQGSNKVTVDWPGDGLYHIWVKEQSTTIDTVCYGVSDSLLVNLFNDPTNLELDFVGIRPDHKRAYQFQWFVSDTTTLSEDISIYASQDFTHDSELITLADKKETYYSYADTSMNFTPMSFKIASINGCSEKIESEIHTVIFLSGTADSVDNSMSLQWTPYFGWGNNIMQYEILYRKDDDLQFSLVASLPPGQTAWSNNWGDEAFLHHYRIRAIHSSYPFESWSNELTLSFEHSFEIPNVFTPNGDGFNDTFTFPELELFRENELTVIDRYGKEVFTAKNYDGHWKGAGLASGTYYYSFQEYHYGKSYKGWVRLLR